MQPTTRPATSATEGAVLPPPIAALLERADAAATALAAAVAQRDWPAAGHHDASLSRAASELAGALGTCDPAVARLARARLEQVRAAHAAALDMLRGAHRASRAELKRLAAGRRAASSYRAAQAADPCAGGSGG